MKNVDLNKIVEDHLIALGEDGESFAIEIKVFNDLYEKLKEENPEEHSTDLLCEILVNAHNEYFSNQKITNFDLQLFHYAVEKPYKPEKFGIIYISSISLSE